MKKLAMKNVLGLALVFVFSLSMTSTSSAQNMDYKQNIYVGTGFSYFGIGFKLVGAVGGALTDSLDFATFETSNTPALQIGYDYALTKNISVGGFASYQHFSMDIGGNVSVQGVDTITEDLSGSLNRLALQASVLFHYGNKEKLDMYSGVRLGYKRLGTNIKSTNSDLDFLDLVNSISAPGMATQLVIFGLRGYVTDNIGISGEIALGTPHFLTVGVNYRL